MRFWCHVRRGAWTVASIGAVLFTVAVVRAYQNAELTSPPPTQLVLDRHGRFLGEIDKGNDPIGYWPVDPIPPRVATALVAIEDQHFWHHGGVDASAVVRALWSNASAGRHVSGASTIAMQVARMQAPGPRTYPKKIVEALTAMMLVHRFGHEAVLAHYLRLAPYANRIRGIDFAARRYFDKPVADLSFAEIAFLSAIPQSPSRMNPYDWRGRERAIRRGQKILLGLAERGVLDDVDLLLAQSQIESIGIPARRTRPASTMHALQRLRGELVGQPPLVHTSIDLELQDDLQSVLDDVVFSLRQRRTGNGALIVLDRTTQEVLVYLGSADYFDTEHKGAIDYAATPRSPGSTLKPFVYGYALDNGIITPATILDDLFRARGGINNADDRFLGPLLPRVALANSRNIPAANLVELIGLDRTDDFLADLGLHDRARPAEYYGAGIALGLLPVTLVDLVSAYGALATDGRLRRPSFVRDHQREGHVVFSEDAARQITMFLSDPLARLPTFRRMGASEYPFPVALKTGTSQGYRDAWTIAYTRRYVIGAWLGRPDAKPMQNVGGVTASALVRAVVARLHREDMHGFKDLSFPPPDGHWPETICAMSGALATPHCDQTFVEHFAPGTAPHERCAVHVRGAVQEGLRTFVDLPPRYASWAVNQPFDRAPPGPSITDETIRRPRILRPEHNARMMRDPEVPAAAATLALVAEVDPNLDELVWYVDGVPFEVSRRPFVTRWPLTVGDHTFEARAGGVRSDPVRVIVDP